MYPEFKKHDQVLLDIKKQISRIKSEISPFAALEMGNEIQRHLNSTLADIAETLYMPNTGEWWKQK